MKVSFAILVFYHFFVSTSMASSAHGWKKSRGDDIGANRTETHQQLYSITGNRRVLALPFSNCYTQFFVGSKPPTGFIPHNFANSKYICQKIEQIEEMSKDVKTLYVTMFDEDIGIAVYAGYKLPKGAAKWIGTIPRIQKWTMDEDIERQGTNKGYKNNGMDIEKGHLVPANMYSFDCLSMVSTFSYTNAVPQYKNFNKGQWKRYENRVIQFAQNTCKAGDLYLLTGTSEAVVQTNDIGVKKPLRFFPKDDQSNRLNIAIPNSMWTAGCCIIPGVGALGGFAAIGNNEQANLVMPQVTVKELENILEIGIGSGWPVKLFPGNDKCSDPLNQYRYEQGQWTKAKKTPLIF